MLELLSPAGSMEALRAAVQNGANAVYLGVGNLNARQSAKNFTPQTLVDAVKYCHVRGVDVHLTLNTLVSDREMKEAAELIRHAAQYNIDAFIVQDLGVVQLCRQIAPHIPIHGSTQMTVHSLPGVQLCAAMGMKRVVLSRELSREEIRYICANSPIEIEVFAHGALCMSYSGQCYLSAAIGGRSGNRGRCAQPCRQSYGYGRWEEKYPLSLKDNCLVHYLKELEGMGVASVKLEGRMKKPEYVATVTAVYRKAIDEGVVTKPMMDALMTAFNRQGFTDGYYTSRVNRKMFGIRQDTRDDPQWLQAARQSFEAGETPLVDLKFRAVVTVDGSSLTATDPEGRTCTVNGPRPELARNVALTGEMLAQRVAKTGGTPYRCVEVRTRVDPGLIISAAAVNAMRRDVLNQLTALRARREDFPINPPKSVPDYRGPKDLPGLTVQVTTREQLTPNLLNSETAMLYVPLHILAADPEMTGLLVKRGRLAVVLPRIVHDEAEKRPGSAAKHRREERFGWQSGSAGPCPGGGNADSRRLRSEYLQFRIHERAALFGGLLGSRQLRDDPAPDPGLEQGGERGNPGLRQNAPDDHRAVPDSGTHRRVHLPSRQHQADGQNRRGVPHPQGRGQLPQRAVQRQEAQLAGSAGRSGKAGGLGHPAVLHHGKRPGG